MRRWFFEQIRLHPLVADEFGHVVANAVRQDDHNLLAGAEVVFLSSLQRSENDCSTTATCKEMNILATDYINIARAQVYS